MIRCNWCQLWFHERCMNIDKDETVGFWACTVCRDLPRTVLRISEQLSAIANTNMDVTKPLKLSRFKNSKRKTNVCGT